MGLLMAGRIPGRVARFSVGDICDGDRFLATGTGSARAQLLFAGSRPFVDRPSGTRQSKEPSSVAALKLDTVSTSVAAGTPSFSARSGSVSAVTRFNAGVDPPLPRLHEVEVLVGDEERGIAGLPPDLARHRFVYLLDRADTLVDEAPGVAVHEDAVREYHDDRFGVVAARLGRLGVEAAPFTRTRRAGRECHLDPFAEVQGDTRGDRHEFGGVGPNSCVIIGALPSKPPEAMTTACARSHCAFAPWRSCTAATRPPSISSAVAVVS